MRTAGSSYSCTNAPVYFRPEGHPLSRESKKYLHIYNTCERQPRRLFMRERDFLLLAGATTIETTPFELRAPKQFDIPGTLYATANHPHTTSMTINTPKKKKTAARVTKVLKVPWYIACYSRPSSTPCSLSARGSRDTPKDVSSSHLFRRTGTMARTEL